jgi:hypothetical protein
MKWLSDNKGRFAVKKAFLAVLAVGAACLSSTAAAAPTSTTVTRTHNNVTCEWRTELGGDAVCRRSNGTGYFVVVSQQIVTVQTARKIPFWRNQPRHSVGYGPINDNRITFAETHNGITCAWTSIAGGGAFCNKASRHGYVAGLTQRSVIVSDERSRVVFLRNQP